MESKNDAFQKESPNSRVPFSGSMLNFGRVTMDGYSSLDRFEHARDRRSQQGGPKVAGQPLFNNSPN